MSDALVALAGGFFAPSPNLSQRERSKDMEEKLASVEQRFNELTEQMADPELANDYARYAEVAKQHNELQLLVVKYREWQKAKQELAGNEQLAEGDDELAELARMEIEPLQQQIAKLGDELKLMLVPKDPKDDRDVIVEIRAGAGGDEAGLFAADLFRMYTRYAEDHRWKVELLDESETGIGGYKEVVFAVKGKGAYSRLKFESGVHRVQRIPSTEANGRIHTSTVTVAVLPEVDEVEVNIPMSDLEIETYRSRGAGGQNVQKNESAVRIIHKPTGLVVAVQDERSQTQNRLRALSILRARLYEMEQSKINAEMSQTKRDQIGTGDRSEKIRTYNYPQNRVTDHRIGMDLYRLPAILDGDLDEFIDELSQREQAERLQAAGV
jgi:peptide chain release factor 1